jgi:hypothetical protein
MMERTRDNNMKTDPVVHVALVSMVVAWRPPRIPSVAAAPPPIAASPPPFPDWRRTTTPRKMPSRIKIISKTSYKVLKNRPSLRGWNNG